METKAALVAKAEYLADAGDESATAAALAAAEAKTAGQGPKLDLVLVRARLQLALGQTAALQKTLERGADLAAKGSDWERRNRLRVYQAVAAMSARKFDAAAELFLGCIATFTACVGMVRVDRLGFFFFGWGKGGRGP